MRRGCDSSPISAIRRLPKAPAARNRRTNGKRFVSIIWRDLVQTARAPETVRVTLASGARHSRKRCALPPCVSEKPIKYLAEGVSDRFRIITLFRLEIASTDKYLDPAVFYFDRDNSYTGAPTLA